MNIEENWEDVNIRYKDFFSNKDELGTVLKQLDAHKMLSKQPNLLSESLSTLDVSGLGPRFMSRSRKETFHNRSFFLI